MNHRKTISILLLILMTLPASLFAQDSVFRVSADPNALTDGSRYFSMPVWSPDGRKIAFTGERQQGIWILNSDGSKLVQLTDDAGTGFGFQWSSDSKEIVCRASKYERRRRHNAVKVYNIMNQESRQLTEYRTFMPGLPRWTSDNSKVFLFTDRSGLEIFDAKREKSETSQNAPDSPQPIYYLSAKGLNVMASPAGQLKSFKPVDGMILNEKISPDGKKIAFEVVGKNMFVIDADGSNLVDLGRGHRPAWSPDSKYLTYMISKDDGHQFLESDIYIIGTDGKGKMQITHSGDRLAMNPDWSPDGKKIAFNTMEQGIIYTIDLNGN
ncbi:PD40 domain-containing protein [candidate division KSB1 bacterium]|nr:PD40 domain-containing protein [candidate division KSB1 bacterium]